ncbi:MAG TPA: hypothetical protein VHY22_05345 [Chthoniobacteraceae bacterium]|jgi:hypothetical protein|nr:hypothetical protein [Chthoniobacteraceae bacterium]
MKSLSFILTALFAAAAIAAGVLWWNESQQSDALARQVNRLEAENDTLTRDAATEKQKVQEMEAEAEQLRAARAVAAPRLEPAVSPTPEPEEKKSDRGGFFSRMFKDPEMRKMIAAQQAGALRGIYAPFVKEAHLTPDEAGQFYQLLQDRQMALMDSSADVLSGSGVDMSAATAATNSADDALKSMLGSARYATYEQFEKTLADRIEVQQLGQQLDSVGTPLQDDQSQALIQIMSEERANLPALFSGAAGGAQPLAGMGPDSVAQYTRQLDAMNQRVYNRAMSILSPPQLTAFAAFQKNVTASQIAGLKMAQGMMNNP